MRMGENKHHTTEGGRVLAMIKVCSELNIMIDLTLHT